MNSRNKSVQKGFQRIVFTTVKLFFCLSFPVGWIKKWKRRWLEHARQGEKIIITELSREQGRHKIQVGWMGVSIEVRLRGERSFQSQRKNTMGWEPFLKELSYFHIFLFSQSLWNIFSFFSFKLIWSCHKLRKKNPNFKILDHILNKKDYLILLICVLDTAFTKDDFSGSYHYFPIFKKNTKYIHIK